MVQYYGQQLGGSVTGGGTLYVSAGGQVSRYIYVQRMIEFGGVCMNGIPSCPLGIPFVARFLVPRDMMEHDGNYLLWLNFRRASLNRWGPIALQKNIFESSC